jgi:hypothetical protein
MPSAALRMPLVMPVTSTLMSCHSPLSKYMNTGAAIPFSTSTILSSAWRRSEIIFSVR